MEDHRILGPGFKEVIYKDAIEYELRRLDIPYDREKIFTVDFKGFTLPHKFAADFIVYNAIVLEAKAVSRIIERFITITLNYLKAADLKLGIIANFGESSFKFKRVVL